MTVRIYQGNIQRNYKSMTKHGINRKTVKRQTAVYSDDLMCS